MGHFHWAVTLDVNVWERFTMSRAAQIPTMKNVVLHCVAHVEFQWQIRSTFRATFFAVWSKRVSMADWGCHRSQGRFVEQEKLLLQNRRVSPNSWGAFCFLTMSSPSVSAALPLFEPPWRPLGKITQHPCTQGENMLYAALHSCLLLYDSQCDSSS